MNFYNRHILPRLVDCACGFGSVTRQRRKVVPLATGRVLEIGVGSGLNLRHYDPGKVSAIVGLDPDDALLAMARRRTAGIPIAVKFLACGAESIPLDDASVDTVVVTYTLCSIPGVDQALRQIRRVLAPGGRVLFCEHGLAPDAGVAALQRRLQPLWGRLAGGCHLARDIPGLLRAAGFTVELTESDYLRGAPRFAGYHFIGAARSD